LEALPRNTWASRRQLRRYRRRMVTIWTDLPGLLVIDGSAQPRVTASPVTGRQARMRCRTRLGVLGQARMPLEERGLPGGLGGALGAGLGKLALQVAHSAEPGKLGLDRGNPVGHDVLLANGRVRGGERLTALVAARRQAIRGDRT